MIDVNSRKAFARTNTLDARHATNSIEQTANADQPFELFHGGQPQAQTLNSLAGASWYNDWVFSVFEEFLGNRVLEIGCGTGNFTLRLLRRACEVTAIDVHSESLRILAQNIRVPQGRTLTVRNQNFLCDMTGLSGYDTVVLVPGYGCD
jgi:2-polyprenyl-3-methyl-5-hydroxy-6-metoxy-1,4-benzoquinol methylase